MPLNNEIVTIEERAISALQKGNFAEAESCWREILLNNDSSLSALNNLGISLLGQEKFEEALVLYQKAILLYPEVAQLHYNHGLVAHRSRRLALAKKSYSHALALNHAYVEALQNLGALLSETGDEEGARKYYERLLEITPDHVEAIHNFNALAGITTPKPPLQYVEKLFDEYAPRFDLHLIGLGYDVPRNFREVLHCFVGTSHVFEHGLDLGCGTGLVGASIQGICNQITGVDVSPNMLSQAQAKNIYTELVCQDLHDFLGGSTSTFDLFLAADVLIYLGDLRQLFAQVRDRARTGALFLFSIESVGEDVQEYVLRPSGRYAHNERYILHLAVEYLWMIRLSLPTVVRKDRGRDIPGTLFLLQA